MDKAKGLAKNGWHPSWDKKVSRETWKSDLKGMAPGAKKKDPYADQKNHQSAPLSSLKDPASFGPPPKSTTYHGDSANASPSTPTSSQASLPAPRAVPAPPSATTTRPVPTPQAAQASKPTQGGWGAPVPVSTRKTEQEQEAEEPPAPPQPYRVDTSGLRTDHLPKPPLRRATGETPPPVSAGRGAPPGLPSRQTPTLPARQTPAPVRASGPPPVLPPRQNEYPDEHTPAPPPPYSAAEETGAVNAGAASRLGQAGVRVPGLDIGGAQHTAHADSPAAPVGHGGQLSELQQRFARMGTGGAQSASSSGFGSPGGNAPGQASGHVSAVAAAAAKKPPPPPPGKKPAALSTASRPPAEHSAPPPPTNGGPAPPPLPLASKPRPT